MTSSPWIARFSGIDANEIRDRFTHYPNPLDPDFSPNSESLSDRIMNALDELAVPSTRVTQLCEILVARAKAHATRVYPDARQFLLQINRPKGPRLPDPAFPVCITGPSGIGKSKLLKRMKSVLPSNTSIAVDVGHKKFPLMPAWYLSAKDFTSITEMLRRLISFAGGTPSGTSIAALTAQCRRLAYQCGICMVFLDELQFLTKSQSATSQITKTVYQLMALGVPVTFVANYSLVHSLERRPDQDRQRLLGNLQHLNYNSVLSVDWNNLINGITSVCPRVLQLEPDVDGATIHNLCAGTPRLFVRLIEIALSNCTTNPVIKVGSLRAAYDSSEFSVSRRTVEKINQQIATGESEGLDLHPPVDVPHEESAALQQAAQTQAETETAVAMVENSLSQTQRDLLEAVRNAQSEQSNNPKVVPLGKQGKPRSGDLEVGREILEKLRKD